MNRVIKFRAWDNDQNLFYYFDLENVPLIVSLGAPVQQFTGLVDIKENDIYEGDIVSFYKRMYEVAINFNGYYLQRYKLWRGKFVPAFSYALSLITKPNKKRENRGEVENAEVVGNVYQNPDFLEKIKEFKGLSS